MRIAITGASGLIGSSLEPALRERGHDVVRLVRHAPAGADEIRWDPAGGALDTAVLEGVGAIVHLAGENIGQRWSDETRRRIRESRVRGTRLVAEAVGALEPRPVLLCASAVGYYGQQGDERLTEDASRGEGFLAEVVEAWESAADPAREAGARVVHFRQAPILARHEGMIKRMSLPFKLGLGGRVGSGDQWWSWVTLDDIVSAYLFALERPLAGTLNLVAPGVVRNRDFVDALGDVLHRPTVLPLPAAAVRLVWGDMGDEFLLGGQRAVPDRILGEGFTFAHPELGPALEHVLRR
jgi:uncharacterized protein